MVLFTRSSVPALSIPPLGPLFAEIICDRAVDHRDGATCLLAMPPASFDDELPETVLAITVKVPELKIPPPSPAELLPETVQFVRVSVPSFSMAPPFPPEEPSVMVRPEMSAVASASTSKTWYAALPLTLKEFAPGPTMLTSAVMAGRVLWSVTHSAGGEEDGAAAGLVGVRYRSSRSDPGPWSFVL